MPKGVFNVPDSGTRYPRLDAEAAKAERPVLRQTKPRLLVDGEKTYHVYLAEEVLSRQGIFDSFREDRYKTDYDLSSHPRRRGRTTE